MIKAILFDLDETLVNRVETMRRFLVEQHRFFPELVGCSGQLFADFCLSHQANGYASKLEAYESVCESLKINNNGVAKKLFSDFKERYGTEPVLFSGVFEVLKLLQGRYRLGLVTNGRTKSQMAKVDLSGMSPFFSSICISESFGRKKPDRAIFAACLNELSVRPDQAVFVGDNPIADIQPAREVGMLTVWVKNACFSEPKECDGVITGVVELPGWLKAYRQA